MNLNGREWCDQFWSNNRLRYTLDKHNMCIFHLSYDLPILPFHIVARLGRVCNHQISQISESIGELRYHGGKS